MTMKIWKIEPFDLGATNNYSISIIFKGYSLFQHIFKLVMKFLEIFNFVFQNVIIQMTACFVTPVMN